MLIIKGLRFPQTKAALVHFDEVIKNIAFPNVVHIYNKIGKEKNEKEGFIYQLVTYYRAGTLNIFFYNIHFLRDILGFHRMLMLALQNGMAVWYILLLF